jgi:hypothetical protein
MLCLHNVSNQTIDLKVDLMAIGMEKVPVFHSALSNTVFSTQKGIVQIQLDPYEILWLKF